MSNVHNFDTREDINEQACVWISRIDRGLNEQEKDQLSKWMAISNAHREVLFELASLWDDMSVMHQLSSLFPLEQQPTTQIESRYKKTNWQIAASIAFVCLTIGGFLFSQWNTSPDAMVIAAQHASTLVGEQRSITLSDGSTLHLNTNSAVSIRFTGEERRISLLRGEAYFDVAHEKSRPFVVAAGRNTVTAIGTAFNVQLVEESAFELVVTEGRVLVQDKAEQSAIEGAKILSGQNAIVDQGLIVFSGEKATVDASISDRKTVSQDLVADDLAWQKGMLVFKGETLDVVLKEITRYTPMRFQISDEALKRQRVAGYFKVGDIDGLLNALENSFSIKNERVSEYTILLSQGA
ncbi:FecR domain-containing protein [Alteromonas sp. ASW11-36]|uniref:FecR domain-containing protein n=1 Tax=Alteromonas arenosi TaxID=3055817 RepID=A0ABT7SUN6_9ALTE|nr:FecR domain-containing protein [Alteromonas sp. ASW11-36]MDM7859891.1 FecR domain-containing protein [Alteromonas sp. ASW11-36]